MIDIFSFLILILIIGIYNRMMLYITPILLGNKIRHERNLSI